MEEAAKQLAAINDQIAKKGSIDKLMADVTDLTKQVKDTEATIANQEQQKALAEEKVKGVADEVKKLQDVDARSRRGQVEPGFTARVSQTYPDFGFVVLNKGNSGGMFANAVLDVKRGKSVVARVKVREVEPTGAIADLVPGYGKGDTRIQPGDLVVPAPMPAPAPEAKPAAPGTPAPGGAPAAPGAAPSGAPAAAPGMTAPSMADPFGAPPAGAPAAPAAPAPAAPAPATAVPFAPPAAGAAPAPAAGAAPATPPPAGAAPAEGTPAKPSTADPFAPK